MTADVDSCAGECDRLFNELDGRAITIAHRRWRIEVYGISNDAGWRWLQLSLKGPAERALTLRMTAADDAPHIVRALSSWLVQPSDAQHILSVASPTVA